MYDVDGNGVIDIQEMTKIVQVNGSFFVRMPLTDGWLVNCITLKIGGGFVGKCPEMECPLVINSWFQTSFKNFDTKCVLEVLF